MVSRKYIVLIISIIALIIVLNYNVNTEKANSVDPNITMTDQQIRGGEKND